MTITATRISEYGRRTGQADLTVTYDRTIVYVKLGQTRVMLSADRFEQLLSDARLGN